MQLLIRQFSGVSAADRPLPQQDAMLIANADSARLLQQPAIQQQLCLEESPLLLAVADGVSASPAAAIASRMVLQLLAKNWQAELINGRPFNSAQLRRCQQQLTRQLAGKPASFGASTTVAVLEIGHGRFKAINAGDSRIWRYRQGVLEQLSVDHSFAAELQQQSDLPLAQCYRALTSYLAADPDAEDFVVSVTDGAILHGDQLLLTTDGIHDEVPANVLAQCLALGADGFGHLNDVLSQYRFDDNASLIWLCC